MIRIPDQGRFELRLMDGSSNPYLLQASVLAAGLLGLNNKSDPGEALCSRAGGCGRGPGRLGGRGARRVTSQSYEGQITDQRPLPGPARRQKDVQGLRALVRQVRALHVFILAGTDSASVSVVF